MGFSWTNIIQHETEIAAAHINQVKTNVDSVYTDLELPAYGWAYLPVSVGDEIQHEDFKELRYAIDYADNMNYCRSHNVSYMGADDAVARGTVYTAQNSGYDSGYKAGVDSNYDSGVDGSYQSGVETYHNSGFDSYDRSSVLSGHYSNVLDVAESYYVD